MAETDRKHRSPDYGGRLGYGIFHWCLRLLGVVPAYALLAMVVPYYVVFRPDARRSVAPYLKLRFPDLTRLGMLLKTVKYFYAFGQVLIDQAAMGVLGPERFKVDFPKAKELHALAHKRKGLVLLTTHAGNWQTAMANMGDLQVPVHFQLRLEAHTAGRHFFDLGSNREMFRIVSPDGFLGGMVELTNAVKSGECVSVMGDRSWGGKTGPAVFLGQVAEFPIMPYHLTLHTDSELVVLLTARTGKCAYRIEYTRITGDCNLDDMPRNHAIQELMHRYVACLEDYLARHPLMWFNCFDFWSPDKQDTP